MIHDTKLFLPGSRVWTFG